MSLLPRGFYVLKCGCVRYSNRHTQAVKKGYELQSYWAVEHCTPKHESSDLSGFEEALNRLYLEHIEGNKNGKS